MRKTVHVLSGLMAAFFLCVLCVACSDTDTMRVMRLNKSEFTFGAQGGKERMYDVEGRFIEIQRIKLSDKQTGKVLFDTLLFEKPKEIVVEGVRYCQVEYQEGRITNLTFDWCKLTSDAAATDGWAHSYEIEVFNPNPQKYILKVGVMGVGGVQTAVIQ